MPNYEASLTQEFNSLVKQDEVQTESFFAGKVDEKTGVVGETIHFKRRTPNEAIFNKARHAPLEVQGQTYNDIEIKPKLVYHTEEIDKFDMLRRTVQYKESVNKVITGSLARAYDYRIRDVLDAALGSLTQITGAATDDAGWQNAKLAFSGYTQGKQDLNAMIRLGALKDTLADPNIKNNFWLNNRMMAEGELPSIYGFKAAAWDKLTAPTPGTNRRCWFWIKNCIGVAVAEGVKIEVNYVPERLSYLVTGTRFFDAAVIDPLGVKYMVIADA